MLCFEQLAKRCPGQPVHPIHPPLVGKTWDDNGNWVWRTSLAATYPTELCQAMANCYCKWPQHHHGATHPIQWVGNNRLDPLRPLLANLDEHRRPRQPLAVSETQPYR